jgi:predicted nuclease with TOPRIM domain
LGESAHAVITSSERCGKNTTAAGFILLRMLRLHKQAMSEIKSARQRTKKATEERDKLKEKLRKAQERLAAEKEHLRASLAKLES